jgi:hypothetical protein
MPRERESTRSSLSAPGLLAQAERLLAAIEKRIAYIESLFFEGAEEKIEP